MRYSKVSILFLLIFVLALAACGSGTTPTPAATSPPATETPLPPTATSPPPPTETKPKPTATPSATAIILATAAAPTETAEPEPTEIPTEAATDVPEIGGEPRDFSITLLFTENSCGYPDGTFPFEVTFSGTDMTMFQTDAAITTTGTYDAATGAFMTSGPVGDGVETYEGTLTFGTEIVMTGTATYEAPGACVSVNTISGTGVPLE